MTSKRKRRSRLAIVSLMLGLTGVVLTMSHAAVLSLAAIPLALLAMVLGVLAAWVIRRRPFLQGKGMAVSGAGLGAAAIAGSFLVLGSMLMRQIEQQQQQQRAVALQAQHLAVSPLPDEPAEHFTSNLPIVVLHTGGQSFAKHSETVVQAEFFDVRNGRASYAATPDYAGFGAIQLRGNTSLQLPKRSYTFHTVDRTKTNQIKVPLLGLPREEDWVLYAPFEDKTMIRDVLAFELAAKMGHYAPRTRFVELFINGSGAPLSMRDYAGVYVLMEKIKRGKERVNIAKLDPQDRSEPEITGGYIVKRDHFDHRESHFNTAFGGPYFHVYPKPAKITREQQAWLVEYFNRFEAALHGDAFKDPQTGYAAYLDVDSFIDAHWLIEMSKNVDGFRYSAFLTKDRGGKLKAGPPWDWNRSFGNANYYGGGQVQGWYWSNLRPNEISWFLRLQEDPEFVRRSTARWWQLRKDVLDPRNINARVDELAAHLEEAQQRNFERWPVLGRPVTCNYYVGDSYHDEVAWLKKWIERRIAWIDHQLGAPSVL